jgi:hypothetical protein
MGEVAREWAESTPSGERILETGYRKLESGFERVDQLPPAIIASKVEESRRIIKQHREILGSLQGMEGCDVRV